MRFSERTKMESAASGQYFCDYERVTLEPQLQAFDCTYGTAACYGKLVSEMGTDL